MKISNLLIGAVIGVTACVLVSATTPECPSTENIPRYHVINVGGSSIYYAYDAVTGEFKEVSTRDMNKNTNIKDLLAK